MKTKNIMIALILFSIIAVLWLVLDPNLPSIAVVILRGFIIGSAIALLLSRLKKSKA